MSTDPSSARGSPRAPPSLGALLRDTGEQGRREAPVQVTLRQGLCVHDGRHLGQQREAPGPPSPVSGGPDIPGRKELLVGPRHHHRPATPGNCLAPQESAGRPRTWHTLLPGARSTAHQAWRPPASQNCPHPHLAPEVSRTRGTPQTPRVTR